MNDCGHEGEERHICHHLRCEFGKADAVNDLDYAVLFDREYPNEPSYALVCLKCRQCSSPSDVKFDTICIPCFSNLEEENYWESEELGLWGKPSARVGKERIFFDSVLSGTLPFEPIVLGPCESGWIAIGKEGGVAKLFSDGRVEHLPDIALENFELSKNIALRMSSDTGLAAIGFVKEGMLWELAEGKVLLNFERGTYHTEETAFPMAFYQNEGRNIFIHAKDWNALDAYDLEMGEYLELPTPTSEHYFQGTLSTSPNQTQIAGAGWVWGPAGIIMTWDLPSWLEGKVRDKPNQLAERSYYWEGPNIWLDERHLAVWGFGNDDINLVDALSIYDTHTQKCISILPGVPRGELGLIDGVLFSNSNNRCTAWDLITKERIGERVQTSKCSMNTRTRLMLNLNATEFTIFSMR